MNCSACDALKAKNKTCWRHPAVQPQSMGLEKLPRIGALPSGFTSPSPPPPSPFVHPVGTMLQDTVSGQLCQIIKHTHMGPGLSNTTPVYEVVDPFTNGTTWIPCCVVASGRYTVVP